MSNVICIEDFQITRKRRTYLKGDGCQHLHLESDDNGEIITCTDCTRQVSAYWALMMLAERYERAWSDVANKGRQLAAAKEKDISLLAAQAVERAWRSKTMLPLCPHCRCGIAPTDGFGGSMVDKRIEQRRREAAKPEPA